MSRNRRKNKQKAKATKALTSAVLQEFKRISEMTQEEILQEKYGNESYQGATNSLGDFFNKEMLKQIP